MFRHRKLDDYQGLLSTGDAVNLVQVPYHQLQQTLCCSLAYIQRCETQAARYLTITAALRGGGSERRPDRVSGFTDCPKIRERYDPARFHAYVDDGSKVVVADMTLEQLQGCTIRAFCVSDRSLEQGDGFRWWDQRPAVTIGPKLETLIERAKSLPPLTVIEENRLYGRFRRLDDRIKELVVLEMGVYEDIPEFAGTELALYNAPFMVNEFNIRAAVAEIIDRLAPGS